MKIGVAGVSLNPFDTNKGVKKSVPVTQNAVQAFTGDTVSLGKEKTSTVPGVKLFNDNFVETKNGNFVLNEKNFRFVGTNTYNLGRETTEKAEKIIRDCANEGYTVIRFWAYQPMQKEKLGELLDLGKKYNIKFIPVLMNHHVLAKEDKNNDSWYKEGYKKDYLPKVLDMVETYKDRPEIFLWELINEPETHEFSSIYNFTKDVSEKINNTDKNHLVSIGTIGGVGDKFGSQISRFSTKNFEKLYAIPTLDAISIHDYSYDATVLERADILFRNMGKKDLSKTFGRLHEITSFIPKKLDNFFLDIFNTRRYNPLTLRGVWNSNNQQNLEIAKDLNKPLYVGEAGFKKIHGENRKKLFDLDMETFFNNGAKGYMMWSFEAQGSSIDGHDYGFTTKDGFGEMIRKRNNNFLKELE